jgi:hypothetical protein
MGSRILEHGLHLFARDLAPVVFGFPNEIENAVCAIAINCGARWARQRSTRSHETPVVVGTTKDIVGTEIAW